MVCTWRIDGCHCVKNLNMLESSITSHAQSVLNALPLPPALRGPTALTSAPTIDPPSNSDGNSRGVFGLVLLLVRLHQVFENPHALRQRHAVRHGVKQSPGPGAHRLDLREHSVRLGLGCQSPQMPTRNQYVKRQETVSNDNKGNGRGQARAQRRPSASKPARQDKKITFNMWD